MNIQCIKCKGRGDCGRAFCPIIAKQESMYCLKKNMDKQDFMGSSPGPFVGHYGYPNVNIGLLNVTEQREDAWMYDAPNEWARLNYDIKQVIDKRFSLVNSRFKANIKDLSSRYLDIAQQVSMASKAVDLEINLTKKPKIALNLNTVAAPTGPNAELKTARIIENPKIDRRVDKAVSDTDLLARDAVLELYNKNFDENFLSKLLSVGNLGIGKNRKLVPTRWSITATDDMIAKDITHKIKEYNSVDEHTAYFGSYLGNYYLLLLFPDVWSYELFETYMPNASWNTADKVCYTTDHEFYCGRKTYAENCAGGYYTVRLAILEKLKQLRKQASVLAIRIITGEYAVPLGVWVTREATRKALANKPIEFGSRELMINYAKMLIRKKLGCDIGEMLKESKLLTEKQNQKRLDIYH